MIADSPRSESAVVCCRNTVTVQNLLSLLEVGETPSLHGYLQMNSTPKKSPREEQTTPKNSNYMSNVMRKSVFCICKNKGIDQLCGNHYIDSTIPLLPKSKFNQVSSHLLLYSPACVYSGQKP